MTAAEAAEPALLRAPRNLVSPVAVWYWTVRAALGWLVVLVLEAVWEFSDNSAGGWHVALLVLTLLLCLGHLAVMPRWRFHVHRWEVTPVALYTQEGWFHQERRIAPISRIQTVDSERGPIEQLFGLAKVTATTASAAGPLRISGLDQATAQEVVSHLTQVAQRSEGDAT